MIETFLESDASYDGVFFAGVRTTGIFCRPSCSARPPLPENLVFFATATEAVSDGYRPCLRCRPLEMPGRTPEWLRPLMAEVDSDPARRWTDRDLRARGLSPGRVRRWFKQTHGMTFHAYSRARRLGAALARVGEGARVGRAAFDVGYDSLSGFQEAFRRYFGAPPGEVAGSGVARVARIASPLGAMIAAAVDDRLCLLEFADRQGLPGQVRRVARRLDVSFTPGSTPVVDELQAQLAGYFSGARRSFDVPLTLAGTAFQKAVWRSLREIPWRETRSYAEVAREIGRPGAVRAVGSANGANALAVVVPCHRVVGADGSLSGYGGGVWRKRRLLELEGRPAR